MKIRAVEVHSLSVPIRAERAITSAAGSHHSSPFALVAVHTDSGLTGIGEVSATPLWSGEDAVTASHVISTYLAPLLIGEPMHSPSLLSGLIQKAIAGHSFTKAAVEMALWDLHGKRYGRPLHEVLGGPVREAVRTKFSITGCAPERAAHLARWAVDEGFSFLKVKVATGRDIERYEAVRQAVGPSIPIGVDANGGWSRSEALRTGRRLADLGAAFLEQPVARHDLAGLALLRRELDILIVADESVGTPEDAAAVIRADAADVIAIYVGMAGGLDPARRIAAMAVGSGVGWTIGSNLEMTVGMAAHLQLAFTEPGLVDHLVPCDIISPFYYEYDIGTGLAIGAGRVAAPTGPGLGVTVDLERDPFGAPA